MIQTINPRNPFLWALALLLCVFVSRANATTQADALTSCNQLLSTTSSSYPQYGPFTACSLDSCIRNGAPVYPYKDANGNDVHAYCFNSTHNGWYHGSTFTGALAPSNPCTEIPDVKINMDGALVQGSSFCQNTTDTTTGGTVQCARTWTPIGVPTWNPWAQKWQTYGTAHSTGDVCNGSGNWKDPAGQSVSPPPPVPDANTPNIPSAPKICQGGSCYDTNTDQFCAVANGQQICVSGGTARNGGGCNSSSAGTICAGSPNAPMPDPSKVKDPATDIAGSDHYTQNDGGNVNNTTVNTYNNNGASTTTSGQQSGDSGPASSSSTGSNGSGSFSGGTNCDSPPACTGDAVACGAARTQWATTCQIHKDLGVGTDAEQQAAIDKVKSASPYTQSDLWQTDSTTDNSVGGQANQGNYDQTGFGIGTACPMKDKEIQVMNGTFVIPFSKGCVIGDWLRPIIIGMALFAAARITMGSKE